jgi:hypothetical protein
MPAQIVRTQFDTHQFAGFDHHHSGGFIGNREYPITGCIAHLQRVFTQSIRHFLRDEHKFIFLAAFGFTQDQFAVLQIAQLRSFSTSPMRIPPRAINSRINRLRTLVVRKMISSMVSFSMIFHLKGTLSRYSLRIMGLSHGFRSSGSILLRTKLKNEESWEKWIRLV